MPNAARSAMSSNGGSIDACTRRSHHVGRPGSTARGAITEPTAASMVACDQAAPRFLHHLSVCESASPGEGADGPALCPPRRGAAVGHCRRRGCGARDDGDSRGGCSTAALRAPSAESRRGHLSTRCNAGARARCRAVVSRTRDGRARGGLLPRHGSARAGLADLAAAEAFFTSQGFSVTHVLAPENDPWRVRQTWVLSAKT